MTHFDLAIIGTGSGNSLVTPDFDDKRVAVIEEGLFGGTCLNVGCIPTKMFVYAAEVADTIRESGRYGVDATLDGVRWRDIRDRVFGRIDPIEAGGREYRENGANTTAYEGHAEFVGPRELRVQVGSQVQEVTADQIVIATGAHSVVPEVISESGVPFHTSDTIMRIDQLPSSMVILGGGFIASEFAHVFSALGVQVRIVNRSGRLLRKEDEQISEEFTQLAIQQWDVHLNATVVGAKESDEEVALELEAGEVVSGEVLLVATGREPNTLSLGLEKAGVATHSDGRVRVDEFGRTNVEGVWSLGDASSAYQLKHVANHEARIVAHNLVHPDDLQAFDHRFVPSAVFTHPQIASVGMTEADAREAGVDVTVKVQKYGDTAYGWAMEDTTSIFKVIADRRTKLIVGAHVMGSMASSLIQPIIQAMSFGQTAPEVARGQYWIHPALAEVVENALLGLEFD
ncbi:mycothione reductase [Flexivirga endophytica]|uniref:Mycothione reductase n=1 Tax=Flexivirga endophytica TaxID=1849103 RepID=A0A916TE27_9MICO|nr:mycothione reductase [Flexivirga endophytica]GGB39074.1 mycothione reductase [Flexivirga endophytica]GHB47049.1 mycothione reductase [Flexivirga endophytica]